MTMVFPRLDCRMKPSLVARYALAVGLAITWMGLAGLVLIAGCAGAPGAVEDMVLLTGVAVDGPKTIAAGESGGFTANAIRSDGGTEDITSKVSWSVVSGPGTVGEGGVYTAPVDLTESVPVTIRASYSVSGLTYTQEAAFTATGSSLSGAGKVLAGVSISGPATVPPGGQGNFMAVASYSDGSTADVTSKAIWQVVGVGTIDARGVYLAPDSVNEDTPATIKAQYSEVTTPLSKATVQENTIRIVVKRNGASGLVGVSISGPDTVNQGDRGSFTLIATYGNGSTANVTLNSSWQVASGLGTIGTAGVYLAPAVVSADTSATIAASYTERGIMLKASKKITIPKISRIPVSLTINGPAEVTEGGTGKFSSTLIYNDSSTADVTAGVEWSAGGTGTIGADGLYTAPSLVTSATSVTIRGTYRAATGALSAEKAVQIANTSKVLTGVTISGPAAVAEGANGTCTVMATYDDASTKDVTANATWSVTNGPGTIAGGVYSAPATVLADTSVTIAVSYAESGVTRQGTQVITVTNSTKVFSAVQISGANAVPEGGIANYTATATYDDGTTAAVTAGATWSVGSGPGQIDANGVYTAPATVSADTPASLHVSYTESGLSKVASKSITVTVGKGPVTLITVGAQWRYRKGNSAPPQNWNAVSFDDSGWLLGASGIGYSTDVVYPTVLSDMYNSYASFYARRIFQVSDPAVMVKLSLTLAYDDGFVAYINGVEVARSASMGGIAGSPVYYNTLANASHDEQDPEETFDISLTPGLLQAGNNVLAIETHNVGLTSSDAGVVPQLDGYAGAAVPGNQAPVANAGPDQTVADSDGDGVQAATLYGIGSSDADGTIVSYVWNEGATKLATGVTPIVTLPVGTHTITLTVTDDGGLSSTDTTVITVFQPLVANAGADQTLIDGDANGSEQVTLNGTGSTSNGGTISSYVWKEADAQIASGATPSLVLAIGVHTITLTVTDNRSYTATDTVRITVSSSGTAGTWVAPIGIPTPSFGIEETHMMYQGQTYNFSTGAAVYPDAGNGPYTHYVDNTHPSATDTNNTYGTPSKPRATIPLDLTPGSVVEIHGGPYAYAVSGTTNPICGQGTAAKPIFVRGIGSPRFVGDGAYILNPTNVSSESRYIVVEGMSLKGLTVLAPAAYISVRNCDITGQGDWGALRAMSWSSAYNHDVVFYNNVSHDNGDWHAAYDQDYHGIQVGYNCSYIWVVDNVMYHNSGDGLQINAGSLDRQASTHHIYVGRNESYENKQTGLWCKEAVDVIFSQNIAHDHVPSGSSTGAGMGCQYGPERIWFIYNKIYNCNYGIIQESTSGLGFGTYTYIVGNLMYNIHDTNGDYNPNTSWSNAGIMTAGGDQLYIVNNTIYDADGGVNGANMGSYHLVNNIISNIATSGGRHIFLEFQEAANTSDVSNCLLYQGGQPIRIQWGGASYGSIPTFQAGTGRGSGCLSSNPSFVNAAGNDLTLASGSPCIDAGKASSSGDVYQTFANLYGININVDLAHTPRPQGAGWDIGALEH